MFHAIRRYFSKAIMLAGTATFRVCGRIPRRSSTDQGAGDIVSLAQPVFRSATSESHVVHFACHPQNVVMSLWALDLTLTCNPHNDFGHLGATDSRLDTATIMDKNNASYCSTLN